MRPAQSLGGRLPPATLWILFSGAGLFVATAFSNRSTWIIERFALSGFGLERGDYWTVASALFLHVDAKELIGNGIALWAFGTPLERDWGTAPFLRFFFRVGLIANGIAGLAALVGVPGIVGGFGPPIVALIFRWSDAIGAVRIRIIGGVLPAKHLAYGVIGVIMLGSVMSSQWLGTVHLVAGLAVAWLGRNGRGGSWGRWIRWHRRRRFHVVPKHEDSRYWN